jgi:hydroxymethylpyrimidine pyrophosphatase-like HAD family hydrolase
VELGLLEQPIVTNSGAPVKDPLTHATRLRLDLDGGWFEWVAGWLSERERRLVSFTDRDPEEADFLIARESEGCPYYDEYVRLNREHAEVHPRWLESAAADARYHLCAIGTREEMRVLEREVQGEFGGLIRTFVQKSPRYMGTMCEILPWAASKWHAVAWLLGEWGIPAERVAAFGDDANDLPMLEGAGLGVAMSHAPEGVLRVADVVRTPADLGGLLYELLE